MGLHDIIVFASTVLGIEIPKGADLFDAILILLRHYHPTLPAEEWCRILFHRFKLDPSVDKLLDSEEARDALGDDECKFLDGYKKENSGQGRKSYLAKCQTFADDVAKKHCSGGAIKGFAAKLKVSKKSGDKILAAAVASRYLDEADALLFLPPDSKTQKSAKDNRWRCSWPTFKRSRTWTLYGDLDAFARCARYVWENFTRFNGLECPWKFINDMPLGN